MNECPGRNGCHLDKVQLRATGLAMLFDERRRKGIAGGKRALWALNQELERGNAIRTYEGARFMPR
jgi:hypothetical protein